MIDPTKISNFNLTDDELEENILFWICAAGKNGVTAAKLLNKFLTHLKDWLERRSINTETMSPFELIRKQSSKSIEEGWEHDFQYLMRYSGIGNHTCKSKGFIQIANSGINLKTCTVADLSAIHCIGPKTARAFLVHTRPDQRLAVIDTHILKFLRDQGIIVPKSTPPEGKLYRELEADFLNICDVYNLEPHVLDLDVWNHYRVTPDIPFNLQERYGER